MAAHVDRLAGIRYLLFNHSISRVDKVRKVQNHKQDKEEAKDFAKLCEIAGTHTVYIPS